MAFYPPSPKDALVAAYVGKNIRDVPTPAAVLDVSVVRQNSERMLGACKSLELGWRAHVKTHKTVELTKLQVGDDVNAPVNLIVSTLAEAEFLLPTLEKYRSQGRAVNVLYGLPINNGALSRLAAIASSLGQSSISFLIDDPAQVPLLARFRDLSGVTAHAHIKIDMGGRRAGVVGDSQRFIDVASAALQSHADGSCVLAGLYSHAGHSYGGDSRAAAVKMLRAELEAMLNGVAKIATQAGVLELEVPFVGVSAGASPTALSIQNLVAGEVTSAEVKTEVDALTATLRSAKEGGTPVEIHAGVYPTLDLQQLAAHSVEKGLSWGDIALTILAEVHATYPGRGANGTTEALIGAGGLALGREFCKAYDGMAMLTPWGRNGVSLPEVDVEEFQGWMIGRFAQEHGILTWGGGKKVAEVDGKEQDELKIGQLVRLWPNHACITSSHFGWYFVVDGGEEIVDIWVKARGW